jgi:hypothetical protein
LPTTLPQSESGKSGVPAGASLSDRRRSEHVGHPSLKLPRIIAQPPFDDDAAAVVLPYPASGVQVVLEPCRSREHERPVNNLPFVTVSLLRKRSIVTEEDDAEFPGVGIIEPIVDASLGGLVAKNGLVGLYQKVAAVEPVKLFDAGDGATRSEDGGIRPRSRLPPPE